MHPALYEAATSGDVRFFREKITDGVSINLLHQKTPKDNNILHISAEFKQVDFFKNVDSDQFGQLFWATNKRGDTPLHVASRVGCDDIVELLIKYAKKSVSHEGSDEESGLPDVEAHKQLLRMTNLQKDTAMHVAARCGHYGVVELLLRADPESCCFTNEANDSPLFLATRQGFIGIAEYILREHWSPWSPSFQGNNGVTALHAAVSWKLKETEGLVKLMLSKNPELIKVGDAIGWTPLHYAALGGNLRGVQILLEADSSASYTVDKYGMSALHVAAYIGHISIIKEVIRCRPDTVDLINDKGQTVLHAAISGGQAGVVKYILETPKFARLINEADADGNTPLHLAVIYKDDKVVKTLTHDPRVNKMAMNNKFSLAADTFLRGDENFKQDADTDPSYFLSLGTKIGVPYFQEHILHDFIKLESPENETSSTLTTAEERQNSHSSNSDEASKRFDTNLLVAMLIATVTFAAAFTMPGGFKSDGTPVLLKKASFQVFLLFDSLSFFLAIFVVVSHFFTANLYSRVRFANAIFILYSLVLLMVAFSSAVFVVLPKGNWWLGILVYVICGCFCLSTCLAYQCLPRKRQRKMAWLRSRKI